MSDRKLDIAKFANARSADREKWLRKQQGESWERIQEFLSRVGSSKVPHYSLSKICTACGTFLDPGLKGKPHNGLCLVCEARQASVEAEKLKQQMIKERDLKRRANRRIQLSRLKSAAEKAGILWKSTYEERRMAEPYEGPTTGPEDYGGLKAPTAAAYTATFTYPSATYGVFHGIGPISGSDEITWEHLGQRHRFVATTGYTEVYNASTGRWEPERTSSSPAPAASYTP